MIYSYYFDTDKTHLLNCSFEIVRYLEKEAGNVEIMLSAEIAEVLNGIKRRREYRVATFTLPPIPKGQEGIHDIDTTRVRFSDQKKWVFTILNTRNNEQKIELGLISDSLNKNPLGLDIYQNDEEYQIMLRANNLSILETSYYPPKLTQTMADHRFNESGYPQGFSSYTANYDAAYQNFILSDFVQAFIEPIPVHAEFTISLDIAPIEYPLEGNRIFDIFIQNVGRFSLLTNGLEYLFEGGVLSDTVRTFFPDHIDLANLWNNGMTTRSRLTIKGDGNGVLTMSYNNHTLVGTYNQTKTIQRIEYKGAIARK